MENLSRTPVHNVSLHGSITFQPLNELVERHRLSNQLQTKYGERSSRNMPGEKYFRNEEQICALDWSISKVKSDYFSTGEKYFRNEEQTCALDLSISKVKRDYFSTNNETKNRNVIHDEDKSHTHTTNNILQNSNYVRYLDMPCSSYDTKSNLNPVIHPSYSDNKIFTYDTCNKKYKTNRYLKRHLLTHTEKDKLLCSICNKPFASKKYLKTHLLIHSDKELFLCSFCGKQLSCKSNIDTHLLIHAGKKPFSCSNCDKRFTQKIQLENHILTHTGEKPHKCKVCQRRFNVKSNLTRHMLTHAK